MRNTVTTVVMLFAIACGVGQSIGMDGGGDVAPDEGTVAPSLDWVTIPGGSFNMGGPSIDGLDQTTLPVHKVNVPPFQISRTEVTVSQYQSCVTFGSCTVPPCVQPGVNFPVVCVDWIQSRAFCTFVGGRLCTEAEWEYAAANGSAGNVYPWGNSDPTCDTAVWKGKGCTTPDVAVGCSRPSGNNTWLVCDLAGNVSEWVEDDWHQGYAGAPDDGSAWIDSPRGNNRVIRGGGFYSNWAGDFRACSRSLGSPSQGGVEGCRASGARCCR